MHEGCYTPKDRYDVAYGMPTHTSVVVIVVAALRGVHALTLINAVGLRRCSARGWVSGRCAVVTVACSVCVQCRDAR